MPAPLTTGAVAELVKSSTVAGGTDLDDIFDVDVKEPDLSKPDVVTNVPETKEVEETTEVSDKDETVEEDVDTTETETPTTQTTPEPVSVPVVYSPDALVEALKKAFPTQAAPVQPAKVYTPEEINKALNVWEPDSEWIARYTNPETQVAALREMRDGMAKQTLTMANVLMQEELGKFQSQLQPVAEAQRENSVKQWRSDFDTSYPQLADPKFEPALKLITDSLKAQNFVPASKEHAFQTIAVAAEKLISGMDPAFKLDVPKTTGKTKTIMPKLPTTTAGGGGGAGGKPQAAKSATGNRSTGIEVFD